MSRGLRNVAGLGLLLPWASVISAFLPNTVAGDSIDELRRLEDQVQKVCRDVMPAVVSVNGASGVIISKDGLVLSQYHVSHLRPEGPWNNSFPPGHNVPVIFQDGRETVGQLLGADRECDLSLLKLVEDGPFPFVPVDPTVVVGLGDWVLKFGHPSGFRKGRMSVVRLGRVVCRIETERLSEFISDCHINGGDSGGPFFDLEGRLVGILGAGTRPPGVILPEDMVARVGDSLWAATSVDRIHRKFGAMRQGEITPPTRSIRDFPAIYAEARTLDVDQWKHGRNTLTAFASVVQKSRRSVVQIFDGNYQAALGTVVSAKGVIVTQASLLPEQPRCVAHNGQSISVSVIGMDAAFDIAVLHADSELTPIDWAEDYNPPVGTFQLSPGFDPDSLAVGVVSVATRDLAGPFPKEVVRRFRPQADPPEIVGIPVEGRGLVIVSIDGNAARSDLEPADELIRLGNTHINTQSDLVGAIAKYRAGDTISAVVVRENQKVQLTVKLDNRQVPIESRRFKAPVIIEHDAPIILEEYGGPILNLDGQATGITVARTAGYGHIAIPGDVIRRIVRVQTAK